MLHSGVEGSSHADMYRYVVDLRLKYGRGWVGTE
jgi:hypothetical protein